MLVGCLLVVPFLTASAFFRYPRWWIEVMLRTRMAVLAGQTRAERLPRTPPGEVVARAMDSDRYARYADRWVDFGNGLAIAVITAIVAELDLTTLVREHADLNAIAADLDIEAILDRVDLNAVIAERVNLDAAVGHRGVGEDTAGIRQLEVDAVLPEAK